MTLHFRTSTLEPLWRLNGGAKEAPRARLRAQLRSGPPLPVPGVGDGLAARIAAGAGFGCLLISDALLAGSMLDLPPSCVSPDQLADSVMRIAGVVDVPLCVSTGIAELGATRTAHALRLLEKAGAAAIWLEDGVQESAQPLSVPAMVAALQAACAARTDPDLIVGVRCRPHIGQQLDDLVSCCIAYREAGAELLVLPDRYVRQFPDVTRVCRDAGCVLAVDVDSTEVSSDDLKRDSGTMWIFESLLQNAALQGMTDFAVDLAQRGSEADLALLEKLRGQPIEDWYQFTGFDRVREFEDRYLPKDALAKYAASPSSPSAPSSYYQPTVALSGQ